MAATGALRISYSKEASARYYQKNKHKWPTYSREAYKADPARRMLWDSRRRVKDGVTNTLIKDEIKIPELCPVFKVPFEYETRYAASLDRIDNSKGYTPDNVQVISRLANTMKRDATKEELIAFANWVIHSYGETH